MWCRPIPGCALPTFDHRSLRRLTDPGGASWTTAMSLNFEPPSDDDDDGHDFNWLRGGDSAYQPPAAMPLKEVKKVKPPKKAKQNKPPPQHRPPRPPATEVSTHPPTASHSLWPPSSTQVSGRRRPSQDGAGGEAGKPSPTPPSRTGLCLRWRPTKLSPPSPHHAESKVIE